MFVLLYIVFLRLCYCYHCYHSCPTWISSAEVVLYSVLHDPMLLYWHLYAWHKVYKLFCLSSTDMYIYMLYSSTIIYWMSIYSLNLGQACIVVVYEWVDPLFDFSRRSFEYSTAELVETDVIVHSNTRMDGHGWPTPGNEWTKADYWLSTDFNCCSNSPPYIIANIFEKLVDIFISMYTFCKVHVHRICRKS